jgi:hypothetical protein
VYCWCWHCYIPNSCTQCTVGADTVTFLTTVHSVLLVLTLLHSINYSCNLHWITFKLIFYIYIDNQIFTSFYVKNLNMFTASAESKINPIQPSTQFTMTAVSSYTVFVVKNTESSFKLKIIWNCKLPFFTWPTFSMCCWIPEPKRLKNQPTGLP